MSEHVSESRLKKEMKDFSMQGKQVPGHLQFGIINYIANGQIPGDFLTAVICNDLGKALAHADKTSMEGLPAVYGFFYNRAPSVCFGSEKNMENWSKAGGYDGLKNHG